LLGFIFRRTAPLFSVCDGEILHVHHIKVHMSDVNRGEHQALNLANKPNQNKYTIQTLHEGNPSVVPRKTLAGPLGLFTFE
jgi:hypothetical protein